jgi:hypothetical protein
VVLMSAEDGLADTIVPRLLAAGGDGRRVIAITEAFDIDDEGRPVSRPPALPDDVNHLEAVVRENSAALVVVDVLNAYLSGRVNSHRDQDIRRALHPLALLADRTRATVVVLRHLNKTGGDNPLYRGGGSIGIIGAARAGLLVAADPDDPTGERRILAVTKSNLAEKPTALAYRLVPDLLYGCARVEWLGPTGHTAGQLLATRSPESEEERSALDEAADFLCAYLAGGIEHKATDVQKAARQERISDPTLARARPKAGVNTRREGFGRGSVVWWSIAAIDINNPHTSHTSQRSDDEKYGDLDIYASRRTPQGRAEFAPAPAATTPSAKRHPCQYSPEILAVLETLILPGEHIHDPFAGPGLRLGKLCDALVVKFSGTDIEDWPGHDPRVTVGDARDPGGYPPAPFTVCTSPVYLNKRFGDYPNGPTPRTKTKGRRDYGIALGRALHLDNFARLTGRPDHADGYWQRHREAVANWGDRVLLNVDGPIADGWVGLLVECNYRIEATHLANTRRYRGLANAVVRADHEVIIVAQKSAD